MAPPEFRNAAAQADLARRLDISENLAMLVNAHKSRVHEIYHQFVGGEEEIACMVGA